MLPMLDAGMLVLALLGNGLDRAFLAVDPRLLAWHRRVTETA